VIFIGAFLKMDYSYYEMMDMPNSLLPVKILSSFFYGENKGFISHWHEHAEILYNFDGFCEIRCNNSTFKIGPGDIVFVNSSEMHSLRSLKKSLKYKVIICDLKKLIGKIKKSENSNLSNLLHSDLIVFSNKISNDKDCELTLARLSEEYEQRYMGYELEIRALMLHFFTIISRKYIKSTLSPVEYKNRKITMGKIGSIFSYIDLNYSRPVSSYECSEMLKFSHSHFCHSFRKVTGKTFVDYLHEVRVLKSINLLGETDLSITQIAFETGFNDPGYFTRVFKKITGSTPSKLRAGLSIR